MDARQYNIAHRVFMEACDLPEEERSRYLDAACEDVEVRDAVARMLASDREELELDGDSGARAQLLGMLESAVGASCEEPQEPMPEQIGPYRVIRKVGQGGMGAVFEAEQDQPRRRVAVKVLRQGSGSPALLKRFRREIELLGRLHHPGIAQIHSAGSVNGLTGGVPYFAMEFVHGSSITAFADEQGLSTGDRARLIAQACDAVHFAHQQGVVHRDLKPQNILAGRSGGEPATGAAPGEGEVVLKILDFGIARVLDEAEQSQSMQTEVGQIIGTLCYMSPEQLAGDSRAIDIRTDVYALGVIFYELLTGRLPHDLSERNLANKPQIAQMSPIKPRWERQIIAIRF